MLSRSAQIKTQREVVKILIMFTNCLQSCHEGGRERPYNGFVCDRR